MKRLLLILLLSSPVIAQVGTGTDTLKILPFGDSQTWLDWEGGYRGMLASCFVDSTSYSFTFVGTRYNDGDGATGNIRSYLNGGGDFTEWTGALRRQCGVSGRIAGDYATSTYGPSLRSEIESQQPHIIILQGGTNDAVAGGGVSGQQIADRIGAAIDTIWAVDPDIKILVWNVPRFPRTQAEADTVVSANAKLPSVISDREGNGFLRMIDAYAATTPNGTLWNDSTHIYPTGYALLVREMFPHVLEALDSINADAPLSPNPNQWTQAYACSWEISTGIGASNWENTPIDSIDFSAATHWIMFDILSPDTADGTIDSVSMWDGGMSVGGPNGGTSEGSVYSSKLLAFKDKAHAAGKKAILCFFVRGQGYWNEPVTVWGNATKRRTYLQSVLDIVTRYGYDGLDFDIEPIASTDTSSMTLFFTQLKDSLNTGRYKQANGTDTLIVTAPIYDQSTLAWWGKHHGLFDRINWMSYDGVGVWTGTTWYSNPVRSNYPDGDKWASDGTTHLMTMADVIPRMIAVGIPRAKVGFGIDFVGWGMTDGTFADGNGPVAARRNYTADITVFPSSGNMPLYDMARYWERYGADSVQYDAVCKVPWMRMDVAGGSSDTMLVWQDTSTVREGIKLMADSAIGGVILWQVTGGWLDNTDYSYDTSPYFPKGDDLLQAVKAAYSLYVASEEEPQAGAYAVETQTIDGGTVGVSYSEQIAATGANGTVEIRFYSGSLPPGTWLKWDGTLAGTPFTPGTYTFTIIVRDRFDRIRRTWKQFTVTIGS